MRNAAAWSGPHPHSHVCWCARKYPNCKPEPWNRSGALATSPFRTLSPSSPTPTPLHPHHKFHHVPTRAQNLKSIHLWNKPHTARSTVKRKTHKTHKRTSPYAGAREARSGPEAWSTLGAVGGAKDVVARIAGSCRPSSSEGSKHHRLNRRMGTWEMSAGRPKAFWKS